MTALKVNTINAQELKKRRDQDPHLCLIDVREDHEWQEQRIPGALHIPKDTISTTIRAAVPELDTPVYLHCRGGVRSLAVANELLTLGYQNVYSIDGGITDWVHAGYPVET